MSLLPELLFLISLSFVEIANSVADKQVIV